MKNEKIKITTDPKFETKLKGYPKDIGNKLSNLRRIIEEAAVELGTISELEETLKWGEPSFLAKKGSTIRIDWKAKTPDQYAIYFKCTSKLVTTFKAVYGDFFRYETTRAILFRMDEKVPEKELKVCIKAALRYHLVKEKTLLGIG